MQRLTFVWFWSFLIIISLFSQSFSQISLAQTVPPDNAYLPLILKSGPTDIPTSTPTVTATATVLSPTQTATATPTDTPTFTPTPTNTLDAIATLKAQLTGIAETQTAEAPTPTPTMPVPTPTPCSSGVLSAGLTTVQFARPSYSALENAGITAISVTLSSPIAQAVTVHYVTTDNTAVSGSDYLPSNGILLFVPGETVKTFGVLVLNDNAIEGNESIDIALDTPICAKLGVPISATLTIIDDD